MTKRAKAVQDLFSVRETELLIKIVHYRDDWQSATGGDPRKELEIIAGCGDLDELAKPATEETLMHMGPTMIRLEAISRWRELTDELIGWAFSAELQQDAILHDRKRNFPDYVPPQNEDRRLLGSALARACMQRTKEYAIAILPTRLAESAAEDLTRLSYGEVAPIFEPAPRKSFKDGYTIPNHREYLVQCAHYLFGTGLSMNQSRQMVADATGETMDAIRNWERAILRDTDLSPKERFASSKIQGAVESNQQFEQACARFGLDPSNDHWVWQWKIAAELSPWRIDHEKLARLGADYQRSLREQKNAAARLRRPGKRVAVKTTR